MTTKRIDGSDGKHADEPFVFKSGASCTHFAFGGAALTAYARLMFEDMPSEQRKTIEQGLKEYCELDTLAMVFLYEGIGDLLATS
jgi:hypothetical protein